LRELPPNADFAFARMAVTPEQILRWALPTRPTKTSDSRAHTFAGTASVELDAIPPADLRELVEDCIAQLVDSAALERTQTIEREERASLLALAKRWTKRRAG
jgi:hypothetical protein